MGSRQVFSISLPTSEFGFDGHERAQRSQILFYWGERQWIVPCNRFCRETLLGDDGEIKGGTGHWPVPSGDPPDGTGEALFLPAETGSPSPPLSAQPGW